MSDFIKAAGFVAGFLGAVALVFFYLVWIFWFLFGVLVIGALTWACGTKITITQSGKKIGYYRWFTFYPYD
jgi:hypothetical protein